MISGSSPINFQTKLIQVRRSLTLSRSYKDSHIDANSLVRDNREWLSGRVDAFCGAFFCWTFLHAENVSAGRQGGAILSRLVCSQPRDLSFPVLTQDDQWILGISFGRRLRHVIRFNFDMRILLVGIAGGIVMFIWTSIAHMALPLGEAGIDEIPNDSAVLSAMQSSIGDKHESLSRQSRGGICDDARRASGVVGTGRKNYRIPVSISISTGTVLFETTVKRCAVASVPALAVLDTENIDWFPDKTGCGCNNRDS